MTRLIKFLLLLCCSQLLLSGLLAETEEYVFNDDHVKLTNEIIEILEKHHFTKKKYLSIKTEALNSFLDRLDPSRSVFLEKEVNSFATKDLDAEINDQHASLEQAFKIFELYRSRYVERYQLQKSLLSEIETLDLRQNRKILKDRTESDRKETIEDLERLWEDLLINDVIQLNLSGNDLNETKNKLTKRIDNQFNFFERTKSEDVIDLYINSIALTYGPHTTYMSPKRTEDFDIDMSLSLEGIGALLSNDGLYTTIASLVPGGPAEKSNKLKPNDRIVGVAQETEDVITDVIGWRIDDVVQLIRGPKNTEVKLEVIPATSLDETQTKIITLTRNFVKLEDQAAQKRIINIKKSDSEYKLGVVELPAFYMDFDAYQKREYDFKSSSKDVKDLIRAMKNNDIDGLIIDLRNNGGGSLLEANALAHLFLGAGTKVQVKTSSGSIHGLGERRGFQFYDGPLAILVNRFSASASEILAGAIQDYERGLILGTDTFGKGTVQRVQTLSSGQIKFTESKFYRVSGKSTQSKGISPDIYLPSPINTEEFGENKLPGALEYDSIAKTRVRDFNRLNTSTSLLSSEHEIRINDSVLFKHHKKLKAWRKAQQEEKFLELNIDNRKTEKENKEAELLTMENDLRKEIGLNTFESYQAFLDREELKEEPDIDEEILLEAANILSDFIEFSYKPVISMNKTG
ncbi:MAG: carboxy terminal-processing peptidase [SAR86 cluster bacterium]